MATAPSGRAPQLRTHTCPGTRLGLPGDARDPAGNEPELARLHGSLPVASLAGLRSAPAGARLRWAAHRSSPARPCPPECNMRARGRGWRALPGHRLRGRVPSPYSRCLSGGCHSVVTYPGPRHSSADQLISRGPARGKEAGLARLCDVRPRRGPAHPQAPAHPPSRPPHPPGPVCVPIPTRIASFLAASERVEAVPRRVSSVHFSRHSPRRKKKGFVG